MRTANTTELRGGLNANINWIAIVSIEIASPVDCRMKVFFVFDKMFVIILMYILQFPRITQKNKCFVSQTMNLSFVGKQKYGLKWE